MTTKPAEDVAAMFDLAPLPDASESALSIAEAAEAAEAIEAAEAALAAELAATMESGGVAADAPDSRTDLRVKVAWPARMQLATGDVIELKVRNISEAGVGLLSDARIPAHAVVNFEMDVPALDDAGKVTRLEGTLKTTYTVAHGAEILIGGTWVQVPAAGLELVTRWLERLRR